MGDGWGGLFVNSGKVNLPRSPRNELIFAADSPSELFLAWADRTILSSPRTNRGRWRRDWWAGGARSG